MASSGLEKGLLAFLGFGALWGVGAITVLCIPFVSPSELPSFWVEYSLTAKNISYETSEILPGTGQLCLLVGF